MPGSTGSAGQDEPGAVAHFRRQGGLLQAFNPKVNPLHRLDALSQLEGISVSSACLLILQSPVSPLSLSPYSFPLSIYCLFDDAAFSPSVTNPAAPSLPPPTSSPLVFALQDVCSTEMRPARLDGIRPAQPTQKDRRGCKIAWTTTRCSPCSGSPIVPSSRIHAFLPNLILVVSVHPCLCPVSASRLRVVDGGTNQVSDRTMHDEARVYQRCKSAATEPSHWRVSAFCSCLQLLLVQLGQFID
jgi:hypothetical protein